MMNTKYRLAALACCLISPLASAGKNSSAETPAVEEYCLVAQRIVTRTERPTALVVHETFDGFVKSKATISEGDDPIPEVQQYNWTDQAGLVAGISCKLKSADHLNLVYGKGTAGPDGACQDMNRYVIDSLGIPEKQLAYPAVILDPTEQAQTPGIPPSAGGLGPQWLQSYVATGVDENGALVIRTKGFTVDFLDPRYAQAPARFRGVHYCHFIAPDHLRAVLTGDAEPGVEIGQEVDLSRYGATPAAE
ncbi:MAG: hypothetical protein ACN4GT_09950 [Gammaproteobacteria bacterium]